MKQTRTKTSIPSKQEQARRYPARGTNNQYIRRYSYRQVDLLGVISFSIYVAIKFHVYICIKQISCAYTVKITSQLYGENYLIHSKPLIYLLEFKVQNPIADICHSVVSSRKDRVLWQNSLDWAKQNSQLKLKEDNC